MALYRAIGDRAGAGLALATVPVYLALAEGDLARAEWLLDESEELLRAEGSWWSLTANLSARALAAQLRDHERTVVLLREGLALAPRLRDTQAVAYNLEGLAGALAILGEGNRAARLLGAVKALRERTGADIMLSPWRELYKRYVAALREQLDTEGLAAAWEEGRAMTFEEVVEYALGRDKH